MGVLLFLLVLSLFLWRPISGLVPHALSEGSFLSMENPNDVLISLNGVFSAGFYPVGNNAYCFGIWFSKPYCGNSCTVVWMANRDFPVNGKSSKLFLQDNGNLILTDAGKSIAWSTETHSISSTELLLYDTGNLVLLNAEDAVVLWQSFDSPTDTLLPLQLLTRDTQLVSSRSKTNRSSGLYKLFFDNDNLLRLLYDGPELSSIYWPSPWLLSWENGRLTFNSSRVALFDTLGSFTSSDNFSFQSADYGVRLQRRLTLDFDGNARMYGRKEGDPTWVVSWQATSQPCQVHGICGPNSTCSYDPVSGRTCSCLPGYKIKNSTDWSYGCEPKFNLSCGNDSEAAGFIRLSNVEFYGYDHGFYRNYTVEMCENVCLEKSCHCKGFQLSYSEDYGIFNCFLKSSLLNGRHVPSFDGEFYLKVPKTNIFDDNQNGSGFRLDCSGELPESLDRAYTKSRENGKLKFLVWFATAFGGVEMIVILFVWCFLIRSRKDWRSGASRDYHLAATGFKRFTYSELKKATRNFSNEIGRGAGGIVYKGTLSDNRVAAIKKLSVPDQREAEFLAEMNTIGKLNHMNLIEMWGYCAERKYRLLVYEYMEHGSLADNLSSGALDWEKRFEIAIGTARGLAYLHEECLEWVLHCDVKPQNILLDSNYQPKVSDFGLSKLLNRGGGDLKDSSFSRIRGTRGYMAPEWIFKLPITSKVDVYSYGIVVLEMVTRKNPAMEVQATESSAEMGHTRLVSWVRDKKNGAGGMATWIEEIIDPVLEGTYDETKMEILVTLAMQCAEEDKDARPTMSKVVETLLHHEYYR